MRDPGFYIRKAYKNALTGNVTNKGSAVPVVDEKLHENMRDDIYIMFSTQSEEDKPNKSYFASVVNLAVLIVNRKESAVQKSVVEDVSNQILQIIIPTITTHGLTIDSPFKISFVKRDSTNTGGAKLDDGDFIIVKQINFRNRITQQ